MERMIKRILDITVSSVALVVLLPIMAICALLTLLTDGHPILFRQERVGYKGRPFTLLKFRTMRNELGPNGKPPSDSERITSLGRFLRKTSIDELPQLWNVLKGDMSVIGPRPLLPEYLPYYSERELIRHSVRPGITGLAQISGRNTQLWDDRLELDAQYVENWTLRLDSKIFFRTIGNVLARKDVIDVPNTAQGPLTQYRQERSPSISKEA